MTDASEFEKTQIIRPVRNRKARRLVWTFSVLAVGVLSIFVPPLAGEANERGLYFEQAFSKDSLAFAKDAVEALFSSPDMTTAIPGGVISGPPIPKRTRALIGEYEYRREAPSAHTSYFCKAPIASDEWSPEPLPAERVHVAEVGLFAYVGALAAHLGLDANLVLGVIEQESNFDPAAVSHAGAIGLMQLMPDGGAREAYRILSGEDLVIEPEWLKNPEINVIMGMAYLAFLSHRYRGIQDETLHQATVLASYNAGPGRVDNAIRSAAHSSRGWTMNRLVRHMPAETRDYVVRVDRHKRDWAAINHSFSGRYFNAAARVEFFAAKGH